MYLHFMFKSLTYWKRHRGKRKRERGKGGGEKGKRERR
jgi:hypothetical protein